VQDYINNCSHEAKEELSCFSGQPNLVTAIRVAAEATVNEKRHPHQRRIPGDTLKHFGRALSDKRKALRACKMFLDLMEVSENVAEEFWTNSKLTVYDTTLRIGAHLGIMPDRVYLHAVTMLHPRFIHHESRQNQSPTQPIRIHRISHKTNTRAPDQSPTIAHSASRALCGISHFRNHESLVAHRQRAANRGRTSRYKWTLSPEQ
jgi:hypothetical protein